MINVGKRLGAALLTIALTGLFVVASITPAAAEPSISITTPAGDRYTPGEPVAFLVEITADKATDGAIIVRVDGSETAREQFSLAGGTTKTIVVVTDTLRWGPGFVVQINSSDGNLTRRPALIEDRESELVGLLPSLQTADLPNTAPTTTGGRTARFHPITELILNADPRAISMFDSIAGTPDDFAALAPDARKKISQWVVQGGQLLVDGPIGTPVDGVLTNPALGPVLDVGFGSVRYTEGEMRRGNADSLVPASSGSSSDEFGLPIDPGQSGRTLVADAGISQPGIEVLLLVIGGYIILVGPVLFLFLRRAGRQPLAWGVIPAIAAITVLAVWGVGRNQRSNVDLAHATIVASLGDISIERSEVLVASANGGFVGLATGTDFTAGAGSNRFGELSGVALEERGDNIGIQLNPGEANKITVQRVSETIGSAALQVSATIQPDRTLLGTVTNTSPYRLQDVRVASGNAVQLIGILEPGETQDVALDSDFANLPFEQDDLFARMQQEFFDPFEQAEREADAGAVNAGTLASFIQQFPESRFTGHVLALGWTREPVAPVRTDNGDEIDRGRTGFMTFEPLTSSNGPVVGYGEATADLVRIWDFQLNDRAGQEGEFPAELLVTLPSDADPTDQFVVELPGEVSGLDLWNGTTWEAMSQNTVDGVAGRVVLLTQATLRRNQVHLRAGFDGFNRRDLPIVRSATEAERAAIAVASGPQLAQQEQDDQ